MTPPENGDPQSDPAALRRERMRRWQPPVNELPVPIGLPAVVFRGDRLAIGLSGAAHSTGLSLSLALRQAPGVVDGPRLYQRTSPRTSLPADEQLFVGAQFSDGRRAVLTYPGVMVEEGELSDGPLLVHTSGQPLGDTAFTMLLWLTPVPPAGTTTLVVRCVALGLPETSVQWDGAPIAEVAAGIVPLWPMPERPTAPPPPQRPTDGWFAAPGPPPSQ